MQKIRVPSRRSILTSAEVDMGAILWLAALRACVILLVIPLDKSGTNPAVGGGMFGNKATFWRRYGMHKMLPQAAEERWPFVSTTSGWGHPA